jgi:hypothetical protein
MSTEGPPLETLTRRLAETPAPFLGEPRVRGKGTLVVPALVRDVLTRLGLETGVAELERFSINNPTTERNPRMLTQILCWLLADEAFAGRFNTDKLLKLLYEEANALAAAVPAREYVDNGERREELARLALRQVNLRPAGESKNVAEDRWLGVSTRERLRLDSASKAAEARARAIRESLARQAAEESADKWSRE